MLLLGPSGAGKSDLLLRLIDRGFALVADDQVHVDNGYASAPAPLEGLVEARGLGIFRLPFRAQAKIALVVRLQRGERLPMPARYDDLDLPMVCLDPMVCIGATPRGTGLGWCLGHLAVRDGGFRVTTLADHAPSTAPFPPAPPRRVVLVTGLSGAGKASILRILEDLGYEAVDNPPLRLMEDLMVRGERPAAIGVDARSRGFDPQAILAVLTRLKRNPALRPELIFAYADEAALLRRYNRNPPPPPPRSYQPRVRRCHRRDRHDSAFAGVSRPPARYH